MKEVHARCTGYLYWAGLFEHSYYWEAPGGRERMAMLEVFWERMTNEPCLWGCYGVEECACLSVLWGEV